MIGQLDIHTSPSYTSGLAADYTGAVGCVREEAYGVGAYVVEDGAEEDEVPEVAVQLGDSRGYETEVIPGRASRTVESDGSEYWSQRPCVAV